jgi:hypothetical protein
MSYPKKIFLSSEFNKVWHRVEKGENLTLLRYGDGERAIMEGRVVVAQEGWKSPDFVSRLGKDLLKSLNIEDSRVFYGISCPCCDSPSYYWYSSRINNPNKTFANLWANANHEEFIKKFDKLEREAVIIANYRAEGKSIGKLKTLKQYEISDDCIDFWENQGERLVSEIINDFGDRKNLLYVISAGPMSEPIIAELYRNNPDNCYIDFGSSIDKYIHGKQTRPYEDKKSIYAKRICWMYDPEATKFDVSVVLTLYKRPEKLIEQLNSIESQTLKPKEVILFHDAATPPISFDIGAILKKSITNYIKVENNVGVWGRFAGGLLSTSKYVCFFDDDTIPGKRWLENCHSQMLIKRGLYGAIGIDSKDLRQYPYSGYRRWGWANPSEKRKEVDFVGHSWFLEKDWLGAMWIDYSRFYNFKYVAEDAFLSYSLRKWMKVRTFVPPHPEGNIDLYGSHPALAVEYGEKSGESIGLNPVLLERMNKALSLLYDYGMPRRPVKMSNIDFNGLFKDIIFPTGSFQRRAAKKLKGLLKLIMIKK